jgi:hypothetical protein
LQKVYSDNVKDLTAPKEQRERDAVLLQGVNAKISQMAGLGSITPTAGAPAVGTVKDGYKFKGGNPADKNNWEKV